MNPTYEMLAMTSLRAARIGISGVVTVALFVLLVHLLVKLLERWDVDSSFGMNLSFSILSIPLLWIALTLGMNVPGIILAGALALWVMCQLARWLLKAGVVEAVIIALLTPVFLWGSMHAGNVVERIVVDNALK